MAPDILCHIIRRQFEFAHWFCILFNSGATIYDYVVTADDVGTLLAVDCTPMDDNGRQVIIVM